jgi:hypothetical protein
MTLLDLAILGPSALLILLGLTMITCNLLDAFTDWIDR